MMYHRIFCGVGSNLGDRQGHIHRGTELLARHPAVEIIRISRMHETLPEGGPPQGPYLNGVLEMRTSLSPAEFLEVILATEKACGRIRARETRWGPRTLDLDILFYDNMIIENGFLIIPHPRLHERRFVLEPLMELAPDFVHPVFKVDISNLLSKLSEAVFLP